MSEIVLEGVTKRFGAVTAVDALSLSIRQGELLTLLGPSGCGKTTILRIIAGFERPDAGTVSFDGEVVNDVPVEKRKFGMVFQSYALFPNMNVEGNISFGMRIARVPGDEIRKKVSELLSLVKLEGYGKRMPEQLSGGQKQRVGLARAIALRPRILLLDEPLSALDAKIRQFLRAEIRAIQKRTGITTVYVTHDQEEALAISDRVAIVKGGVLQQVGTPSEVYDKPRNAFIADFIGVSNIIEAACDGTSCLLRGGLRLNLGRTPVRAGNVLVSIRPESIRVLGNGGGRPPMSPNVFTAKVRSVEYLGHMQRMVVECETGTPLTLHTGFDQAGNGGHELVLEIPPDKIRLFDS
jgi:ABC-type Fe3+/spermidine/putrescine transport system ATPase subunit